MPIHLPKLKKTKKQPRWQSYAYLLINTATWGAAFVIIKPAFEFTTPFRFLLYRYLFAVILSLPLLWHFRNHLKQALRHLPVIIGLELIGTTLALTLVYLGLDRTSALEASLLTTSLPLFITLGGVFLLGEKEERHEWIGTMIAFAGTLYLTLGPMLGSVKVMLATSIVGNLLIIGSNISNMLYFPLAKKAYHQLPKLLITTISFYVGLVSFFFLALVESRFSFTRLTSAMTADLQTPAVLAASGYMALFGSIIGLTAYIKGQDGIEASEAGLFYYLQPLIYIPLAFLVLGDAIDSTQLIGLAIILLGVFIAEKRFGSRPKSNKKRLKKKRKLRVNR